MKKKYTVKYVNHIDDKGYPVHKQGYAYAHKKANEAEKKLDPKMYHKEEKAQGPYLKKHPKSLLATHDKKGDVKIQKGFKKFSKTLIKHERTEWQKQK